MEMGMSSDHQFVRKQNMIGRLSILCLAAVVGLMALPMAAHAVSFDAARLYGAGANPCSVAVGDFNGDGDLDLAVTNASGDEKKSF
jgi:hypothetical protein